MTAPVVGFKERIAERRATVASLWEEGLTVREIGKRLLSDPTHDGIIRHDLKQLGVDPSCRATPERSHRGDKRKLIERLLCAGEPGRKIARQAKCTTAYVHQIARMLRWEGKLAEVPSAAEVAERRAAWYAEELRAAGSVPVVAAKLGVTEASVYYTLNSHGYSVRDIREGVAA